MEYKYGDVPPLVFIVNVPLFCPHAALVLCTVAFSGIGDVTVAFVVAIQPLVSSTTI